MFLIKWPVNVKINRDTNPTTISAPFPFLDICTDLFSKCLCVDTFLFSAGIKFGDDTAYFTAESALTAATRAMWNLRRLHVALTHDHNVHHGHHFQLSQDWRDDPRSKTPLEPLQVLTWILFQILKCWLQQSFRWPAPPAPLYLPCARFKSTVPFRRITPRP